MKSDRLSRKLHSRAAAAVMLLLVALYMALTGSSVGQATSVGEQGIALSSVASWPLAPWVSMCANIVLNLMIMLLMVMLNSSYNVLRTLTYLPVGLFALMQAAVPARLLALNSGTVVCIVVALCLFVMFGIYESPWQVRKVFLVFMLLSLGAAAQYCFFFFIPVFWIVCVQMKVMTARGFVGSLLGIATVWIILLGFGIIVPDDIRIPHIDNIFNEVDLRSAMYLLTTVAVTALLLVVSVGANFFKTVAYNAHARAMNGALLVVSLATLVAMIFDYGNIPAYLPLLNFSAAIQITHYFNNHRYERQYISVLVVAGIYIALLLWRLTL